MPTEEEDATEVTGEQPEQENAGPEAFLPRAIVTFGEESPTGE